MVIMADELEELAEVLVHGIEGLVVGATYEFEEYDAELVDCCGELDEVFVY